MFFGALRSVIRPVVRTVLSPRSPFIFPTTSSPSPACDSLFCHHHLSPFLGNVGGIPASNAFHSARRRNEKNRIKHKDRAISRSELKELKAQVREANRRKLEKLKNWEDERKIEYEKKKREKARQRVESHNYPWYRRLKKRRDEAHHMKKDTPLRTMSYTTFLQWRKIHKRSSVWKKKCGKSLSTRAGGIGVKLLV